jgi:hypothetical protein
MQFRAADERRVLAVRFGRRMACRSGREAGSRAMDSRTTTGLWLGSQAVAGRPAHRRRLWRHHCQARPAPPVRLFRWAPRLISPGGLSTIDAARRARVEGEACGWQLMWSWPGWPKLTSGRARRTAGTSRAFTPHCQRVPRTWRCGGHRAAVRRVCRHQPRRREAGFSAAVKAGPSSRTFTSVSEPCGHGALTAMPPPRPNARRPAPVRVERIATTPISRPQRDQAVTALAVLITAWQRGTAAEPGEAPASPLPLPGPGERH